MSTPPERAQALERERRRMKPAGALAILGAIAIQAGFIINSSALEGDGTAERLLEASTGDADGQLLLGLCVAAAGFLAIAVPLTFLFGAARARAERMVGQIAAVAVIGSLLIAGGLVANHFSYLNAADDFAAAEAEREEAPAEPAADAPGAAEKDGKSGAAEDEAAAEEAAEDEEEDADERARDAQRDASGATASGLIVRGGAFALAIGFFYTALWSMRTGLLTRFWGSLGMASAVVLALFFLYFFALIWFLAMGFFLLGAWFGARPPAWEAGTAIPWPKPGAQAREGGDGADGELEGTGREVTERPLPESGEGAEPPAGPPPRKRKRRS